MSLAWRKVALVKAKLLALAVLVLLLNVWIGWFQFTPVVQLVAFPWVITLVATALLLSAGFAGSRPLFGLACVSLMASLFQPTVGVAPDATASTTALKVISANLHRGIGTAEVIQLIARERPDLVFLQECPAECEAQLTSAADLGHLNYVHALPTPDSSGSAILSRYHLTVAREVEASLNRPGRFSMAAVWVTLPTDFQFLAVSVHPGPPTPVTVDWWLTDLEHLTSYLGPRAGLPMLLAGDFNSTAQHEPFRRLVSSAGLSEVRTDLGTFEGRWPTGMNPQIDHVVGTSAIGSCQSRDLASSDHWALVCDLSLATRSHP